MEHFLGPLILEPQDDGVYWKVVTEFDYDIGEVGGEKIMVPAGFMTDLGSVPQILWNLIPPIGKPLRGYVLHDWLYSAQPYTRKKSDDILLEAMGVAGVNSMKRWAIYLGVRMGGGYAWDENKQKNELGRLK
jgi:Protein of unknown function (DUF1353)